MIKHIKFSWTPIHAFVFVISCLPGVPSFASSQDGAVFKEAEQIAEQTITQKAEQKEVRSSTESATQTIRTFTRSVITRKELESTYRRDLEALEFRVPGLLIDSLSAIPNGSAITLRGIGSGNAGKDMAPAVNVMIDGVPMGSHQGQNPYLFDLEKIVIDQGSQSTRMGPSAVAGTINLIRSVPTSELGVRVKLVQSAYDRRESGVVINLPAFAGISVKLSAHQVDGDGGYMYNHTWPQRSENEDDHLLTSLSALWQISQQVSMQYTYDDERDRSDTPALLNRSGPGDTLCITFLDCPSTGSTNPQGPYLSLVQTTQGFSNTTNLDGEYHTLLFKMDGSNFNLVNRLGIREARQTVYQDLDASYVDLLGRSRQQEQDLLTNDLRLTSKSNRRFNYRVGHYYASSSFTNKQRDRYAFDYPLGLLVREEVLRGSEQEFTRHAIYSHFIYELDQQSHLDWGLRYDVTDIDMTIDRNIFCTGCFSPAILLFYPPKQVSEEWDKLTGDIGYRYQIDSSAFLYLRASKEYRAGGYDEQNLSFVQPERVESWEIGLNKKLLDGKGHLRIVAWQSKWDEKAESFLKSEASLIFGAPWWSRTTQNLSKVNLNGSEIEFTARLFEQVDFIAAYSHVSADYDKFSVPDLTQTLPADIDLSSYHPSRAPSDTFYLSVNHSWSVGPGQLSTNLTWRRSKDYNTDALNPSAWVNEYNITDLSFDYQWKGWSIRLFATNLFNEHHVRHVTRHRLSDFTDYPSYLQTDPVLATSAETNLPRYTGLEVRYHLSAH